MRHCCGIQFVRPWGPPIGRGLQAFACLACSQAAHLGAGMLWRWISKWPLMVIFKRKTMPHDESPPTVVMAMDEKGWMDQEMMNLWLTKCYTNHPGFFKTSSLMSYAFLKYTPSTARLPIYLARDRLYLACALPIAPCPLFFFGAISTQILLLNIIYWCTSLLDQRITLWNIDGRVALLSSCQLQYGEVQDQRVRGHKDEAAQAVAHRQTKIFQKVGNMIIFLWRSTLPQCVWYVTRGSLY